MEIQYLIMIHNNDNGGINLYLLTKNEYIIKNTIFNSTSTIIHLNNNIFNLSIANLVTLFDSIIIHYMTFITYPRGKFGWKWY